VSECRFEVWPYLERVAEDATKAAKKEEEEEEEKEKKKKNNKADQFTSKTWCA